MSSNSPILRRTAGFSFLEFLVAGTILSLVLSAAFLSLRSTTDQGARQDRTTQAWMTWGLVNEALRDDLAQAQEVRVLSPSHLQLKLFFLGPNLEQLFSDVEWRQEDEVSISRFEGGQKHRFSFSGALRQEEKIRMGMRKAPW